MASCFQVLTSDHLLEYKKQFFVGIKQNWSVCTAKDLGVVSPVKEFWK